MTQYAATDIGNKPIHESSFGNAVIYEGNVTPTGGTSGDVYRVLRIPGGTRITSLKVVSEDLDSAGPSIACKVGYTPVNSSDGPTADDDYWFPTASTLLQSAAVTDSKSHPISFDYDVYVDITLTASAATFASGKISVIAQGFGIGR